MTDNHSIEYMLLAGSVLLLVSIFSSKLSDRFSVPALALFLGLGMLAGSESIGGIYFDNASFAKSLGIVALSFILFSGGLDTKYETIRKVLWQGLTLSTFGVLLTAIIVGYSAKLLLGFSLMEGLLLGAVVSSTDAAAVFSILRSKNIALKRQLKPLLELESGSNDPMAVFLTVGLIQLVQHPGLSFAHLGWLFVRQMTLGALAGIFMAWVASRLINRIKLEYEGLYPVLTFSLVLFTYGITAAFDGNGFLAVYLMGLLLSRKGFHYKNSLMRFHDGLAWLMQIAMFLTLGLLVFPSRLVPVAGAGLAVAVVLCFLARPLSVFLCLLFYKMSLNDKAMIAWVGLRGAAPIVLATFPLLAGVDKAGMIFNVVFFIVLISVLLQGTSLPWVAKLLRVNAPLEKRARSPIELEQTEGIDAELLEFIVPYGGKAAGRSLYELGLPPDSLVVLVCRNDRFIVAKGNTTLEEGDVVVSLVSKNDIQKFKAVFGELKKET